VAQLRRRFQQPTERDEMSLALHPLLMDCSILGQWLGFSDDQVTEFRATARAKVRTRFLAMRRSCLEQKRDCENVENRAPEHAPEQKESDYELSFKDQILARQLGRGSLRVLDEPPSPNDNDCNNEQDCQELRRYYHMASSGWERYVRGEDMEALRRVAEATNSALAMPYERMTGMFRMDEWWRMCCIQEYPLVARLVGIWCTKSDANAFIERAFSTLSIVAGARANRLKSDAGEHVVMLSKNKGFIDRIPL